MTARPDIDGLLRRPGFVLLDGATGTELTRRGVDTTLPLWSARALLDPGGLATLTGIHRDYALAGADLVVTNTFRTTRRCLGRAGLGEADWRELNRRAVAAAREGAGAAPRPPLVAGGLAPLEDCYRPDLVPARAVGLEEHRRQADLLAGLGVDLLILETMNHSVEAQAALEAAAGTGLPVLLSLCPAAPDRLLSGEPLGAAVPALRAAGGAALRALLLNCATPETLETVYPRFAPLAGGLPCGLYAHLGEPDPVTGWRLPERHDPPAYALFIGGLLRAGARIVGGCCGTTPEHIAALRRLAPPQ